MNWVWPALLTALCYGLYNVFIKLASGRIHVIVGALILQAAAMLLGAGALLFLRFTKTPLQFSAKGIWFAVLAGVFVGLAEILSFFVFSQGVPAAAGIPVIVGGTVVAGAALGLAFLGESLSPRDILAVAMIVAGIAILGGK